MLSLSAVLLLVLPNVQNLGNVMTLIKKKLPNFHLLTKRYKYVVVCEFVALFVKLIQFWRVLVG